MVTVLIIVYVAAFVCTLLSISNPPRVPLFVPVLLLCLAGLLQVLPVGK